MPDATQNLRLKVSADTAQAKSGLQGLKGSMTELSSGVQLVRQGLQMMGEVWGGTVQKLIDYNKEIKDTSDSTGMAAEDLSRFVQAADDMGIAMGSVTKALELGTKNGFAPSIDAIAKLADRTNALADPAARAAVYAKIFGKNWAELNPLLSQGGDRIRAMTRAQADGLVVTEAEIKRSEELRLSIDAMNDSLDAAKLSAAGWAAPGITAFLDLLQRPINATSAASFLNDFFAGSILEEAQHRMARVREEIFAIKDAIDGIKPPPQYDKAAEGITPGRGIGGGSQVHYESRQTNDDMRQLIERLTGSFRVNPNGTWERVGADGKTATTRVEMDLTPIVKAQNAAADQAARASRELQDTIRRENELMARRIRDAFIKAQGIAG